MSKKTDYTNAQFDSAELRIQKLFEEIQSETPQGLNGAEVALNTHWGIIVSGHIIIYKIDDTVYMRAVCLCPANTTAPSDADYFELSYDQLWAVPPKSYVTYDSHNNELYFDKYDVNGVEIHLYKEYLNRLPIGPLVLRASWKA